MPNADRTSPDASADEDSGDPAGPSTTRGNGQADRPFAPASSGTVPEQPPRQGKNVGSSVIKIVGGALAAMTAAAIGSGLGVAGTVGGAALVSGCLAVLDSVYTASLHRTRQGVEKVVRTVGPAAQARLPRRDGAWRQRAAPAPAGSGPAVTNRDRDNPTSPARDKRPTRDKRRRVITGTLVAAGVVFVVTLGGVFGVELVTGHSFNGQKGGTTIGQAAQGQNWTQSNRGGNSSDGFQDKDGNIHQPTTNSDKGGQNDTGGGNRNGQNNGDGSQNDQNDRGGNQGNNGGGQDSGSEHDNGGKHGQDNGSGSKNGQNDGNGNRSSQNQALLTYLWVFERA